MLVQSQRGGGEEGKKEGEITELAKMRRTERRKQTGKRKETARDGSDAAGG